MRNTKWSTLERPIAHWPTELASTKDITGKPCNGLEEKDWIQSQHVWPELRNPIFQPVQQSHSILERQVAKSTFLEVVEGRSRDGTGQVS